MRFDRHPHRVEPYRWTARKLARAASKPERQRRKEHQTMRDLMAKHWRHGRALYFAADPAGVKGQKRSVVMNGSRLDMEHDGHQWWVVKVSPASFVKSQAV